MHHDEVGGLYLDGEVEAGPGDKVSVAALGALLGEVAGRVVVAAHNQHGLASAVVVGTQRPRTRLGD
jgi:hypothetical protein